MSWEQRLDRMILAAAREAEGLRPYHGLNVSLYYLPTRLGRWGQLTARQYCPTGFILVGPLVVGDHPKLVAQIREMVRHLPILGA